MFWFRPWRRATTTQAKEKAASTASALPNRVPPPNPSPSMMPMPASAVSIAAQRPELTLSFRKTHPSKAVKKGAALRMNIVLAMVVWVIDHTTAVLVVASMSAPSRPHHDSRRRAENTSCRCWMRKTAASTAARAPERIAMICHGCASSMLRSRRPLTELTTELARTTRIASR